ncbi:MAG: lysozyme inhibitor LprI family protein [Bacteroidota bacterium]|jgi:uncharacterized protein YecT (DUF1311 family)
MKYLFRISVILFFVFFIPCLGQQSRNDSLNQVIKEHSRWEKDLKKITEAAYFYRYCPRALGGGEGSYIGFTLPKDCDSTEFGTYSVCEILPAKLVIQANLLFYKLPLFCVVDSNGNSNRKMSGLEYELEKIGALAIKYRTLPISEGGGGGSYEGFKIPVQYEFTASGRYTVRRIRPDEITIQAFHPTDERLNRSATFDANGRRRMPFDYQIDLKKIESLAYQYRNLPSSQGGGGGSYVGFKIPHNLDSTENGKYWLGNVLPHEMVIKMHPRGVPYSTLEVIDSTGKRKLPDYRQQTDGDVFLKNDQAMVADMKVISKHAADYWKRSKPKAGMVGSFEGFTIPISIAFTENGRYSVAEVKEDTIYIQAISSIGSGTRYFMIDRNGTQMAYFSGQYRPPESFLANSTMNDPLTLYKNADWKLNEVYQQLLARKKSDTVFLKNLKNAERLWIQYRDVQLTEKYPQVKPASDKSMFTKPQLLYLTILTEDRIKELQEMLDQP